mmetsp:Transcript_18039/g.50458  ORF Transcript_18039/g.50458 Transcript_18039/m.50458 type:complete len:208 (+) Transcript_18039:5552-6175(+)
MGLIGLAPASSSVTSRIRAHTAAARLGRSDPSAGRPSWTGCWTLDCLGLLESAATPRLCWWWWSARPWSWLTSVGMAPTRPRTSLMALLEDRASRARAAASCARAEPSPQVCTSANIAPALTTAGLAVGGSSQVTSSRSARAAASVAALQPPTHRQRTSAGRSLASTRTARPWGQWHSARHICATAPMPLAPPPPPPRPSAAASSPW